MTMPSVPGLAGCALVALAPLAAPQSTTRVSVSSGGGEAGEMSDKAAISADGRFVAYMSYADDLIRGDTNGRADIYLHDRSTGKTQRVSLGATGDEGNGADDTPALSADGRFVVFASDSSNLVQGDTNAASDVFVRDRVTGATTRVSVSSGGAQGGNSSRLPSISADGRWVAFQSLAPELVPGDAGFEDIFVHDRQPGETTRVSVSSSGAAADQDSSAPVLSADGGCVAFHSRASNLVAGDTNGCEDIFVHDRSTGVTSRVSVSSSGGQGDDSSTGAALSEDGRYVAFESEATDLVAGDTNGKADVFVHDRQTGETVRVSVGAGGTQGGSFSYGASISADGSRVVFSSGAGNLIPGDTNAAADIYLYDRGTGLLTRVSVDSVGLQADWYSYEPALSADGLRVAYASDATNLVPHDLNGTRDIFVRDLELPLEFTSTCFGDGSGAPCGCGNEAPAGTRVGCLNGFGLGAELTGTGAASVGADTLQLAARDVPAQPGLFFQGDAFVAGGAGATFGDGLRCCGGVVLRLEVVAPPAPEPAIALSTLAISQHPRQGVLAGRTTCHQYWYRDPAGSPCGVGFNLTNALMVVWQP